MTLMLIFISHPQHGWLIRYLGLCVCVCTHVCVLYTCTYVLVTRYLQKLWTDFDEIFWMGGPWPKDPLLRFWWRSGSGSEYGCFLLSRADDKLSVKDVSSLNLVDIELTCDSLCLAVWLLTAATSCSRTRMWQRTRQFEIPSSRYWASWSSVSTTQLVWQLVSYWHKHKNICMYYVKFWVAAKSVARPICTPVCCSSISHNSKQNPGLTVSSLILSLKDENKNSFVYYMVCNNNNKSTLRGVLAWPDCLGPAGLCRCAPGCCRTPRPLGPAGLCWHAGARHALMQSGRTAGF